MKSTKICIDAGMKSSFEVDARGVRSKEKKRCEMSFAGFWKPQNAMTFANCQSWRIGYYKWVSVCVVEYMQE